MIDAPYSSWDIQEYKIWKGKDPDKPTWGSRGFACSSWEDANGLMKYIEGNDRQAVLRVAPNEYSRVEATAATNLRFYRAGIEAGAKACDKERDDAKAQRYPLAAVGCTWCAKAIRDLPDPSDEQQDAIRKGGTT